MAESKNSFVPGTTLGKHISGAPLTTDLADAASPGLLTNDIDGKIVKIRPMATPLDQISRLGHTRPVSSMEVDYYSVDTRIDRATVKEATKVSDLDGGMQRVRLAVGEPEAFEVSDTMSLAVGSSRYTGYVMAKGEETLDVILPARLDLTKLPDVEAIRMGRAATQLDVQSPQFAVLPHRRTNLCQIFKQQIEQSVVMRDSHKAIGWEFTDQQEAAIYDMRMGMEKQFLFGTKCKIYDPVKGENVTITEGVWSQAGKTIRVDLTTFSTESLIDMLREAFTENSGSRRKVLIAGSELITAINKLEATRVITSRESVTRWGIDFSELCSKFGRLYVVYSDIFDIMGQAGNGIVIDPEYIQKHVFIPFRADRLDLRGSGQRNTEAIVLTEASCLTLRYPDAHARIVAQ